MQYLFIGGEADGQRIEISLDCHDISIPIKQYMPISLDWPPKYSAVAETTIKHERYRREAIHFFALDVRIEFFVQVDLTPHQAIERLLAHYAPAL